MNAEVKAKWVEALESGKYEQGIGQLRTNDDRYCCLGVLCDVAVSGGWEKDKDGEWQHREDGSNDTGYAVLPDKLRDRLGVLYSQQSDLTSMNDRGWTFPGIAQHIRENL